MKQLTKHIMSVKIASSTLWDNMGNSCRYEIYHVDVEVFELWLHPFNECIPARHVGPLGEINARLDVWIAARNADGFIAATPDCNLCPIA